MMISETTNLKRAEEKLLLKNIMLTEIEKELRANYEELLRREQEMSVSERRFRRLFENLPVGLVHGKMVYDQNGNPDDYIYLETNEAFSELTGLVNVTGKRVTEVIPGIKGINPELFEIIGRVARTGKPEKFELNIKPLGKWNNVTVYSTEKNYFIAIFDDFTEKKRGEEALQQANKKLNLLSSITRHDINNKLLALDGFIALLHQKMPGSQDEILFSRISETSKQIAAMIRFTKEYEMIGINAPVWQNLKDLVNNAEKSATPGEVTITNDLPAGMEVFADPLIIKVFFNLIDNALRHGGKITTIRFTLEARNSDRVIVCEDDGEGIRRELKERIFERGFGKNTGFGLFISREILDITGLTITETGEPGTGARFEITVPERQLRFTTSPLQTQDKKT
jgi:signal transduction histidine kinase